MILGTNGDDDITIIARDVSTHAGANGVQDFTFSINQGLSVLMLNQPDLFIDAMASDETIVIRTAAPNEAAWDVNVRVAGGSPAIGGSPEADRLVLETPNVANGFDSVVSPTGPIPEFGHRQEQQWDLKRCGHRFIDQFWSVRLRLPPAAFTYTSTDGGVELVEYQGRGSCHR